MKYQKITKQVIDGVVAFINPFATKAMVKDIIAILSPCCKPTFTLTSEGCDTDCNDGSVLVYGASMNGTITDISLANQTVTVVVTSTTDNAVDGGVIQIIDLDNNGSWTGCLQSSWANLTTTTIDIIIHLIPENSSVWHSSDPISVTLNNCD